MATVGYGDITPKTPEGRAIAIAVMLVGIGLASLVIGAAAERFGRRSVQEFEVAEEDALGEIHEISVRLQRVERALRERESAR